MGMELTPYSLTFSQNKITHYYSSTELLTVARNENRQGNPKKITKIEFGIMQDRCTGDIEYLQAPDRWRTHAPELFDTLKRIVTEGRHKVSDGLVQEDSSEVLCYPEQTSLLTLFQAWQII